MIKQTIFREYDIRGIFEEELNEQSVKLIGYFLAKEIGHGGYVAIGYDARTHSPTLRDYLASGLIEGGCHVLDMGLVATPINYFSNYQTLRALSEGKIDSDASPDGSIMITGSHNPPEYNGFKITVDKAPFFGEAIYALGKTIASNSHLDIPTSTNTTPIIAKELYIKELSNQFAHLRGLDREIILDCGNGVANTAIGEIFERIGLAATILFGEPDGTFPNHHPDPSKEENLKVLKERLTQPNQIGFAYDGDADRIAILTPKHNIKGDMMALLFASAMQNPTVVGEVKCSTIMYDQLESMGAKAVMYKTGHSNIKVKMKECDADLACEVSGHIFFKHRYYGYDDAIYATFRALELLKEGVDFDRFIESLPSLYSTPEITVEASDEKKFAIIDQIKKELDSRHSFVPPFKEVITIDGLRINFEKGWALVRASNTTPLLVTRFEATTQEIAKSYQEAIVKLIDIAKEKC